MLDSNHNDKQVGGIIEYTQEVKSSYTSCWYFCHLCRKSTGLSGGILYSLQKIKVQILVLTRMVIQHNGNVGIGVTEPTGSSIQDDGYNYKNGGHK